MKTVSILLLLAPLLSYPAPVVGQSRPAAEARDKVPIVDFCELVENPSNYFDKTVRVTATFMLGFEGAALADDRCPLSNNENVGVGYAATDGRRRAALNRDVNKIESGRYASDRKWALVTVVGLLRNESLHAGGLMSYQYRFDILRFQDIRKAPGRTVINYDGELKAGLTYRAKVRGDNDFDLLLIPPLHIPIHHMVTVDWTNLDEFPALRRLSRDAGERQIVFTVTSSDIVYLGGRSWRTMVSCKIITVE